MSMLLGSGTNPKSVNNVQITQSTQGYPIPVVMGQARTHQSLLFIGAMEEQKVSGAKGGGKGANQYLYYAMVQAAVSATPVTAIGSVWSGQSWLSTQGTNEGITVVSHYSPSSAALLIADNGVTLANTYSATYTDYGQPASTVLSGTDNSPMQLVAYNYALSPAANSAALTTGQYSISTASIGTFNLTAAANASGGNTVYSGTFTSPTGASNGFEGFKFAIAGFPNAANNGTFTCTASSTSSITLNNANGVAQTHAATATDIGNTYHFSSADAGKTSNVWYQLNYSLLQQQDIFTVPSSSTIGGSSVPYAVQVSNQYTPTSNINVQYYGEGNPNAGVTLTQVSGTPTAAGTYKFVGAVSIGGSYYTYYQFSSADLGNEMMATWGYTNQSAVGQSGPELINFELFGGGQGQAVWPFLENGGSWQLGGGSANVASGTMPGDPGQALGYTKISYVAYGPMFLGESAQVQDNTFEVLTADAFGGGITDCNPVQCVYRVLTDTSWGMGSGAVPFPVSAIDNGASGTWGGAVGTPGTRSVGSTAWNWFAANNFFISPKIDSQESASSVMGKWLEAGMCAAYMSEGLLKLVPYGSTSVAANGCTWVGPQSYVVALDDTCFVAKDGEDPVKLTRSSWQDAVNKVRIGFCNRANQYQDDIVDEWDQAAINRYGERTESPTSFDFIKTLAAATFSGSVRVKRSTSIRNSYEFTLPFIYSYLEPMDIVTISTTSAWAAGLNNLSLGVNNLPVRIQKTEDDPVAGIKCTCEDYQALASEPVLFNKQISAASVLVNQWAQPGNSEVVMFEATDRLTKQQGNQIWIGACGTTAQWGGCNVWVSRDNENYTQVGTIEQAARLGVLASSLATGSDPDTVNTLVVNLAENCSPLDAGSDTDADNNVTMCFVGSATAEEIISYSACSVTGDDQYTMNGYLRRGQMGTSINSFAAGSLFMRLDNSVFQYQYDPTWAGQTLYFKFQSFNQFNNNAQTLPSLTATTFVVPVKNPGTIDASSGIVLNTPANTVGAGPLGWTPIYNSAFGGNPVNFGNVGYTSMNSDFGGANANYFYGRMVGYLIPSVTGEYTIGTNSSAGCTLYIGGQAVGTPNLGTLQSMSSNLTYSANQSAQILLTAGVYYPIVLEYAFGAGSSWGIQLLWTPPKSSTACIPVGNLSTVATSINSELTFTIWNGSTGLYYPSGNGLIDPANKILYGPPGNGGGTNVVNGVSSVVDNINAGSFQSGNSFSGPGWIVGQCYSSGGTINVAFNSPPGISGYGYLFQINYASGAKLGTIWKCSNFAAAGSNYHEIDTFYGSTNASTVTGWVNFAIYISASGYLALWLNGNLVADCTDLTYALPSAASPVTLYYGYGTSTGKIAPAPNASGAGSSALNPQGSIATVSDYTLTYSYTTTSIEWTWTAFNVYCPDGSSYSVATSTGTTLTNSGATGTLTGTAPMTFSGLTPGTTYAFTPYVTLNSNGTATMNILGTGGSGSTPTLPTLAQQVQIANGDGNVACSASVTVTAATPASGGGGSGGSGGGGERSCFSPNTKVKTQRGDVAIIDLVAGEDQVLTARGTWKTVVAVTTRKWSGAMLDMGDAELSTLGHLVKDGTWRRMRELGRFPIVRYEGTIHNVHVHCDFEDDGFLPDTEHSYTLANGLVVHNVNTSIP
jgi:hypothetical protein